MERPFTKTCGLCKVESLISTTEDLVKVGMTLAIALNIYFFYSFSFTSV